MPTLPRLREQLVASVARSEPAPPPARKRRRSGAAALSLAVLLAGVSAGATAAILDHTADQSAQLAQLPAQRGDAGAVLHYGNEVEAAARRVEATVPYPPGRHDDFDWATYRPDPGAPSEYEGSLRAFIEFRASCMWRHEWVDATAAKDADRIARATAILSDVPNWPGIRGDRGTGRERALTVAAWARADDLARVADTVSRECRGL
jgi:hypothetical protein